jgi:Protein of unknown function DUF262
MSELRYEQIPVHSVIADFRQGKLVVPEFQREYIWPANRAAKLVESLYRRYPISSLLVWETEDQVERRSDRPKPDRNTSIGWLIDGQQRVITLSRAEEGEDNIDVAFNINDESFSRVNAATKKDPNWVRVADVWDEEWLRKYRKDLGDDPRSKKVEQRLERLKAVLGYQIPVVKMVGYDLAEAVEAFKRINSLGVRLRDADLRSAAIALKHAGFIRQEVTPFLRKLRSQGFGRIAATQLFWACGFIAHPDGRNHTPLHDLDPKQVASSWRETKRAVETATALLAAELGIADMSVLWSGNLLVPLIAYCGTVEPQKRRPQEIAGWVAAAALRHRYSKSAGSHIDQDLKACRAADPIGSLLRNLRTSRYGLWASAVDFETSIADKSALLAMFIACKNLGVKDLLTGGNLIARRDLDRHHIFPRSRFDSREAADTLANIAFIARDSNEAISDERPEVYLAKIKSDVLSSQAIPLDRALWTLDRAEQFWAARRKLIAESLNSFLKESLPKRRRVG